MKALRTPFVATLSAATFMGCPKEPPIYSNPPARTTSEPLGQPPPATGDAALPLRNEVDAGAAPTVTASARTPPIRMSDFRRVLNAYHPQRGMIYTAERSCYVYDNWPDGKLRAPGMMPPTIDVPCPPSMKDPAWQECRGGSISTSATGDECVCFIGGNPPPLPRRITRCPAPTSDKP